MSHSVAPTPLSLNHYHGTNASSINLNDIQTLKPWDVLTKVHGMLL